MFMLLIFWYYPKAPTPNNIQVGEKLIIVNLTEHSKCDLQNANLGRIFLVNPNQGFGKISGQVKGYVHNRLASTNGKRICIHNIQYHFHDISAAI